MNETTSAFQNAVETEQLIRDCVARFDGKSVLLVNGEDAMITSGVLCVTMPVVEAVSPRVDVHFSLRGLTFIMEIPLKALLRTAATWTGQYYVIRLSETFRIQPTTP
jgi:hypothetical protein